MNPVWTEHNVTLWVIIRLSQIHSSREMFYVFHIKLNIASSATSPLVHLYGTAFELIYDFFE